jgi:hypothetical protein
MAVAQEPSVKELLGTPEPYVACVLPMGKPVRKLTELTRVEVFDLARGHWNGGAFDG